MSCFFLSEYKAMSEFTNEYILFLPFDKCINNNYDNHLDIQTSMFKSFSYIFDLVEIRSNQKDLFSICIVKCQEDKFNKYYCFL